jgi:16S rRNA A1518/A1519 N6-dimethyltransferase RsmA/KsgA/DIM1 with predicted DNA glycosylase/AP lyase activity
VNGALAYIDIAIAFVAVMLMATTLVTFLTQFVMFCLSSRRKILEQSIQGLVEKLGLTKDEAKEVKDQVMADPVIAETRGTVVRRERLIEILLDVATRNPKLQTGCN